VSLEILLINKSALRAVRRAGLPFLVITGARESDYAPGLWEVPIDSGTAQFIRMGAMAHGLTVSKFIECLATSEIKLETLIDLTTQVEL